MPPWLSLLPLLGAAFLRHRARLFFTVASIVVAFMLFGLLGAVRLALTGGVEVAGQDRIITTHKVSIIESLPRSYLGQIRQLSEVRQASSLCWFGGIYQDPRKQLVVFAIDPNYFSMYPQIKISQAGLSDWQSDRAAAVVGQALATQYGWKVGDLIPLKSNIYRRKDQAAAWPIKVAAIYSAEDQPANTIFIHYDYFNESLATGRDQIGWVVSQLKNPGQAAALSSTIDALFANSRQETKTSTEKAVAQSFANQIGNIGAILTFIVTAVFFAMLLVTANTMAQSVRERTPELAVLKTLGFTDGAVMMLILSESLFITLAGALLGLGVAWLITSALEPSLHAILPFFRIPLTAVLQGLVVATGLGLAAGMVPAWLAMRLKIVSALRAV